VRRAIVIRRRCRRERGQVLMLGALTALLVTGALLMIFNVSWAVHERIRLQNAADAQAYSMGIHVARTYNYFAYTNRAIAGVLVSMTLMHAYHSEISAAADAYWGAGIATALMAAQEFGQSFCSVVPCCKFSHCEHAIDDIGYAIDLITGASDIADEIKELDDPFRSTMSSFKLMIQLINASQMGMMVDVMKKMGMDGRVALENGGNLNLGAGGSDKAPTGLGGINAWHFFDPLEISSSDEKVQDMTDMANAARTEWMKSRGLVTTALVMTPLMLKINDKTHGHWLPPIEPPIVETASAILEGGSGSLQSPDAKIKGDTIKSKDWWLMVGMCEHNDAGGFFMGPMLGMITPATVTTGKDNNGHDGPLLEDAHQGDNHDLDVKAAMRYVGLKRVADSPYNQPAIYGYAEQDLSLNEAGNRQPWAVNDNSKLAAPLMGSDASLNLGGRGKAKAIAKALVYYHRPGDWKEPPNLFNPFWRVKLHPFGKNEAMTVAAVAGDTNAAVLTGLLGVGTATDEVAVAPASPF
jgi:hypothetical protein